MIIERNGHVEAYTSYIGSDVVVFVKNIQFALVGKVEAITAGVMMLQGKTFWGIKLSDINSVRLRSWA